MTPMLDEAYKTVNEVYVQPRIRRLKARLLLSVVTGVVLAIFGLLALICLFLMVFLGLARAYDPQTAATILFGFCVLICIGTVIVHAVAKRIEDRHDREAKFALPTRKLFKPSNRKTSAAQAGAMESKADVQAIMQDYFAENKVSALAAVAVAGLLVGARPKLAIKTVSWALRRKAKKALRRK